MAHHPLMKLLATASVATTLVLSSVGAGYAFTETKVPPPAAGQPAAQDDAAKLQLQKPDDGVGLSLSSPDDTSNETELTIPGIGSIGKLPKVDFGLELLYGGTSEQGTNTPGDAQNDDVLIKGKIRHRF